MSFNNKDTSNMVADAKAVNANRISGGTSKNGFINQGSSIQKQIINNYNDSKRSEKDVIGFVITEGADSTPTPYFTGREKELEDLREHIASMNKLVLVSGIGGIGKTHLCRYLYREYVDAHKAGRETGIDHIGYLNYYGSMDDTLVNGLKFNRTGNFEEDVASAWRRLEDLANSKRLLVIVDNVTREMHEDKSMEKLYNLTCAVVLTSRLSGFERFKPLPIGVLPLDECRNIFQDIYGDIDASEQANLDYILSNLAAMHTKTVELLASIAHDKGWKVTRLRQELEAKRFNLSFTSEGNETTLQTEYEKLFDLSGLTEQEVNVLEAFSIMPPFPITSEICNGFFNEDAGLTEGNEIFNTLHRKGWLQRDVNSFSMHPVIAEFIFNKQRPVIGKHLKLIEACIKCISVDDKEVFTKALPFMPFAEAATEKLFDVNTKVIGTLSNQIGVIYDYKGEYDKALELYGKALSIYEIVLGKEHPFTASSYNNIAVVHSRKGEYDKALELYGKALSIYKVVLGKEHTFTASSYHNIASVYYTKGDYDKALELYFKALSIYGIVFGKEHPFIATTYHNIAFVFHNKGDYYKALELYFKALSIRETTLGKKHPDTASTYNNIALVYANKGEYDKALELYYKALSIRETTLGKKHPDTASTYNNIAFIFDKKGEYNESLKWYYKGLSIYEKVLGKEHPDTASTYNNIAVVYEKKGEYDKALELYYKALSIRETVFGKEHPGTATTYNNIAVVYDNKGENDKALEMFYKALFIYEKVLGKEHPNTATTYNNIALVYYIKRDYEKSLELYYKALSIYKKVLGNNHPDTASTYNNIAAVYDNKGEYDKALELYHKALTTRETVLGKEHPDTATTYRNIALVHDKKRKSIGKLKRFKNRLGQFFKR